MIKKIPDNFDIAMDMGDESLMPICKTDSHVVQVEFNDTKEKRMVFVLCPCSCDPLEENMESQEKLN